MPDLTESTWRIRDFLQEGNEQLWVHALARGPKGFVGWVVVEERAEGGDALSRHRRAIPLPGRLRARRRGRGVALYRATLKVQQPCAPLSVWVARSGLGAGRAAAEPDPEFVPSPLAAGFFRTLLEPQVERQAAGPAARSILSPRKFFVEQPCLGFLIPDFPAAVQTSATGNRMPPSTTGPAVVPLAMKRSVKSRRQCRRLADFAVAPVNAPMPAPKYGSTPPRPSGRKRTVAVMGIIRQLRSCSSSRKRRGPSCS